MKRYVIAMDRDVQVSDLDEDETATLFWNNDTGFGSLTDATVFTEEEALAYDLPIANNQPEWVELP